VGEADRAPGSEILKTLRLLFPAALSASRARAQRAARVRIATLERHDSAAVQRWLASDAFPDVLSSSTVLGRLFAHSIGTEDPKILASIVDPAEPSAHAIELHISWPDGARPPPSVWIEQEQHHQQQIHLRVKA
jgi:hypothetical protein